MQNRNGEFRNTGRSRTAVTTAIVAAAALIFPLAPASAEDAYVKTDGSNYIITDYYPSCVAGAMTVIDVVFQLDSTSNVSQPRIFAVRTTSTTALSMALYVNGKQNFAFSCKDGDISGATEFAAADTARHRFTYNSKTGEAVLYKADGRTVLKSATVIQTRSTKADEPLRLFCQSSWMSGTKAQGRLYGLKIGEADASGNIEEKHDFSPVLRDGVPGILDSLTGKFFSASGTSALASGGDIVSVASGDAYLESDGAAYINTGYFPTRKTRIEADFSMVETNNVTQPRICGSNGLRYTLYINGKGFFAYNAWDSAKALNSNVAGYQTSTGVGRDIGVRHVFSVDKASNQTAFYTGSATNYSATMATTLETDKATGALYVFNGADWSSQWSKIRLYRLDIYEDGALERSYVPYVKNGTLGLYDTTGGNFHPYESGTYGGAIGHDNCDAYLKSDGTQAIVTDYYPNPDTRIEVDFKLDDTANVAQPRIFATNTKDEDYLSCALYVNGSKNWAYSMKDGDISGVVVGAADTRRHTFILDGPAGTAKFDDTDLTFPDSQASRTKTSATPLWIFAQSDWILGTPAKAKLYSLRIYEKRDGEYELEREYLPWMSQGVGGLYETQTGTVLTNTLSGDNAFAIGGMGTGGTGSGALLVKPQDTRVSGTRPTILSAYAPGAVAYRWTRGGEVLSGENGATLSVERIEGAQEIVYGVTPLFDVFGATVEGETATCVVDHGLLPFVIVVR